MQNVDGSVDNPVPGRASNNGKTTEAPRVKKRGVGSLHRNGHSEVRLESLLKALSAAAEGDFSVRLETKPHDRGVMGQKARKFNEIVARNEITLKEIGRVRRVVRHEGRMDERANMRNASGGWKEITDSVNDLMDSLAEPTAEVARVIMAVAKGDLTQKVPVAIGGAKVKGELLRIGTTVNAMVDQLSSFASEVTRVAKEVGTEGKLGGQAAVPAAAGIWRDLTDNVNQLANNLTAQVRNIAEVTTAVARGNLSKKITVDAKGEVLEVKNTVNTMVDQLNSFAAEVTR